MSEPPDNWQDLISRLERDPGTERGRVANHDAWQELRRRLQHIARAAAPRDDVEDIVQIVLERLTESRNLRMLKMSRSPVGYLAVVIRRTAVDQLRRRRARVGIPPDEVPTPEELLLRQSREESAAAAVRLLMQALPPDDVELLRMRFWRGLSIAQIAKLRGEPYSRIAVRLFRLLRRLRGRLDPDQAP